MILNEKYLREYSKSYLKHSLFENYKKDFNYNEEYDIFISHSSLDKDIVSALFDLFTDNGFKVYLDTEDETLDPSNITAETANILRKKLKKCKCLAFVSTSNTYNSKWCPWELGLFDGTSNGKCCILPVLKKEENRFVGQEYLRVYPFLDYAEEKETHSTMFWINDQNNINRYTTLKNWINGNGMIIHNQ